MPEFAIKEAAEDQRARIAVEFDESVSVYYIDFKYYVNPPDGVEQYAPFDILRNYWYRFSVNKQPEWGDVIPEIDVQPYASVELAPDSDSACDDGNIIDANGNIIWIRKNKITYLLRYIAVALAVVAMQSCVDDFEFVDPAAIPEGEGDMSLELNFEPLAAGNLGRSAIDAPAGDAIKSIKDASILFYDATTGLLAKDVAGNDMIYHFTRDQLSIKSVPRDPQDASNGQLAETHTDHGTATLKNVKFGRYYIFAVANLGRKQIHYPSETRRDRGQRSYPDRRRPAPAPHAVVRQHNR